MKMCLIIANHKFTELLEKFKTGLKHCQQFETCFKTEKRINSEENKENGLKA